MKKKTNEQFIRSATSIHQHKYTYTNTAYDGDSNYVVVTCPIHGDFRCIASNHLQGSGCPKCGIITSSIKNTKSLGVFLREAKNVHGNKYDYSQFQYVSSKTKGKIVCHVHGIFEQTPENHILSGSGCKFCGINCAKKKNSLTNNEFIKRARKIHEDLYEYHKTKYNGIHKRVIVVCKTHGDFTLTPANHLYHGAGCPKCVSRISSKESEWLDSLNIPQQHRQVTFKLGKRRVEVDGYDPETNTIYEFWGDYWHGNPKKYNPKHQHPVTKRTYGEMYEKTQEKRELILNAGYNLIEMWESAFEEDKL